MSHSVYIGIGSNLGNRAQNCLKAVESISSLPTTEVEAVSEWRESEALTLKNESHPHYINGAVKISTEISPVELLNHLKEIETKMGRPSEHERWSPRVIDLDILFYDDLVMKDKNITIPHPEVQKRGFVLSPLCDIEPLLMHPVLKKTVKELNEETAS